MFPKVYKHFHFPCNCWLLRLCFADDESMQFFVMFFENGLQTQGQPKQTWKRQVESTVKKKGRSRHGKKWRKLQIVQDGRRSESNLSWSQNGKTKTVQTLDVRMSMKLHYIFSHRNYFLDNFGDVSEEQFKLYKLCKRE